MTSGSIPLEEVFAVRDKVKKLVTAFSEKEKGEALLQERCSLLSSSLLFYKWISCLPQPGPVVQLKIEQKPLYEVKNDNEVTGSSNPQALPCRRGASRIWYAGIADGDGGCSAACLLRDA